ncbi:catalase family protein [Microvirga arsenatis]|uniref:hypothetical protein n=1 Tax=Microvirga arsenatis TaxID=2692265 RepID=UPI001FEADCF5|nr:hypothetical protein [Microvirga arsenatis]
MAKSLVDLRAAAKNLLDDGVPAAAHQAAKTACEVSFREETRRIFVDVVQARFIAAGQRPSPRPVFRKVHGVAKGTLRIDLALHERYRYGLFAQREFTAWVRFSSDTSPDAPDSSNATIGIGIKLFGVHGETLDSDDPDSGTADLLMQNHDRFFVDTGRDFCAFSDAAVFGDFDAYLAANPETKAVLDEMAKPETSVLAATYWSVLPYACGPEAIVKYRLRPVKAPNGSLAAEGDPHFLRTDVERHLLGGEASFELALQPFSTDDETPVDAATRRWPTPFQAIGALTLAQQDLKATGQAAYGDNLSFNPWRTPDANRPLGSIADARQVSYRSAAYMRRTTNGVPAVEPGRPR